MKNHGFTLVELVTTITVAAILTALAVPSFTQMLRGSAMTAGADTLVSALNWARSEAIRRDAQVEVVPVGGNWVSGWNVQLANGSVIRYFDALGNGYTFTVSPTVAMISYNGTGTRADINASSGVTLTLCDSSQTGETGYNISVASMTGRVSIASYTCS